MSAESAAIEAAIYEGEWVIAISAAGKFLGKPKPDTNAPDYPSGGVRLEPVYEVLMVMMQQPNGQPTAVRQVMPVLLITVDIGLTLGKDAALIRLAELPQSERASWLDLVRNVRAGMLQLRAQRSGVVLPGR